MFFVAVACLSLVDDPFDVFTSHHTTQRRHPIRVGSALSTIFTCLPSHSAVCGHCPNLLHPNLNPTFLTPNMNPKPSNPNPNPNLCTFPLKPGLNSFLGSRLLLVLVLFDLSSYNLVCWIRTYYICSNFVSTLVLTFKKVVCGTFLSMMSSSGSIHLTSSFPLFYFCLFRQLSRLFTNASLPFSPSFFLFRHDSQMCESSSSLAYRPLLTMQFCVMYWFSVVRGHIHWAFCLILARCIRRNETI